MIERLGSPDHLVREEAARTLEERGPDVLPVLRAARDAAVDRDARDRLSGLIRRLESRSLDRPTPVPLEFDDRPLGEAVEALAASSGFAITLDNPALADRRVSVRAGSPLPFWEALDRLGRAGNVRHDPGPPRDIRGEATTIHLVDGQPPRFTAYSGPFRIHLFATHLHRDISFEPVNPPPSAPRTSAVTVTVEVQAFVEPGRFVEPDGLPRLEAIDGAGRPLSPDPGGGAEQPEPFERSTLIPGRLSMLHWHVPLGLPDPPPRSPLKLRGTLPVVISSREPAPLDIPLADASGKTFRREASVVRVENASPPGARPQSLTLVLGEEGREPGRGPGEEGPRADDVRDSLRDRLEIEDAEGRPLPWQPVGWPRAGAGPEPRIQVYVSGQAPPARLRVYRLRRVASTIRFEFDHVPPP